MKKILITLLISFFASFAFGKLKNVGPLVWITGNIVNNSSFNWFYPLDFVAYDQDINAWAQFPPNGKKGNFVVQITQGSQAAIFIAYNNQATLNSELQCKFSVVVDNNLNATITETPMDNSYVKCSIIGNPNDGTATIFISDNSARNKK